MNRNRAWLTALGGVLGLLGLWGLWTASEPPQRLPQPAPEAHGTFSGKFELVPLFDAGHRPVIRNGHAYEAERNLITFRTDAGDLVEVFPGETTDGASIPRLVWPWLPPDGPYYEAAAFHDACFKSRGDFSFHGKIGHRFSAPYDYHGCNEILREGIVALGAPTWERIVIFEAVEWFGGAAFGH